MPSRSRKKRLSSLYPIYNALTHSTPSLAEFSTLRSKIPDMNTYASRNQCPYRLCSTKERALIQDILGECLWSLPKNHTSKGGQIGYTKSRIKKLKFALNRILHNTTQGAST